MMQNVEILVKGQIDNKWSDWFDDFAIDYTENGDTVLTGAVADQAAMYGVLSRLRDLGLQLISVVSTE